MRRKLLKRCRNVIESWEMNRTYMVLCKIIGVICFVMLWGEIFAHYSLIIFSRTLFY